MSTIWGMYFVSQSRFKRRKLSLQVLKPKPSFHDIEKVLDDTSLPIGQKCKQLYDLVGTGTKANIGLLHRLRFIDMLFCKHEGAEDELE